MWCGTSFHAYLSSVYLLWWDVYSGLSPIFKLDCLFSYCWALRVLFTFWVTVLFIRYISCKYFSQSVACLLILLTVSSAEQKSLILMKFSLSIISFMDCALGVVSKKSLPYSRSSRNLIVLHFTFRSIFFFLVNFCEWFKVCVQICFLAWMFTSYFWYEYFVTKKDKCRGLWGFFIFSFYSVYFYCLSD